jgi:hypothetical protein
MQKLGAVFLLFGSLVSLSLGQTTVVVPSFGTATFAAADQVCARAAYDLVGRYVNVGNFCPIASLTTAAWGEYAKGMGGTMFPNVTNTRSFADCNTQAAALVEALRESAGRMCTFINNLATACDHCEKLECATNSVNSNIPTYGLPSRCTAFPQTMCRNLQGPAATPTVPQVCATALATALTSIPTPPTQTPPVTITWDPAMARTGCSHGMCRLASAPAPAPSSAYIGKGTTGIFLAAIISSLFSTL